MSLLSVAQSESNFLIACNLDSSSTEKVTKAGLTFSSSQYGTITQNNSSITGNYSFDFSSNGRVLHQYTGTVTSTHVILEGVFKRSSIQHKQLLFVKYQELQFMVIN